MVQYDSECGVLLPSTGGKRAGLACRGIVSQRVGRAMLHFDGSVAKNRGRPWERSLGVSVEGPPHGKVEPVFETIVGTTGGASIRSALADMKVEASDNLNLDVEIRVASDGTTHVSELLRSLR